MTIHSLWPTLLWENNLDPTVALTVAQSILPSDQELRSWSDVRPWSSTDLLHEEELWAWAVNNILEQARSYADAQGILYKELYISSMWVNAQYQRQNHQAHVHANSLFSGVWYLDVPLGSQCFMLFDPRPASGVFKPRNRYTVGNISVAPSAGLVLMWPSWLQHSTQSITVDELDRPRVAIAFNVMLRDDIDQHSQRINLQ